jgi:molybdopterin/thiamine biosynthesis adenylyltransferase/rhodanese-related sulfurtransferase
MIDDTWQIKADLPFVISSFITVFMLDPLKSNFIINAKTFKQTFDQEKYLIVDIRKPHEWETGTLPQAQKIPMNEFLNSIENLEYHKNQKMLIYCESGKRSAKATSILLKKGYQNIKSLEGGIQSWKNLGYQIEFSDDLSDDQRERFSRHIRLNEVGLQGQKKIFNAKVLIVGMGGLGCPIASYLNAAGIGTLGLVDHDRVELSNLQRQVLYTLNDIGTSKVLAAKKNLINKHKEAHIKTYCEKITPSNVDSFIQEYDIIINGCDNYTTRYLLNDSCFKYKKTLIDGAIQKFEGRVMVFDFQNSDTACYRCLYPSPPPLELSPNCNEVGVLGVLPGLIGTLQATEALKIILNLNKHSLNTFKVIDIISNRFQNLNLQKNKDCPLCKNSF